jgi:hypothetical protein
MSDDDSLLLAKRMHETYDIPNQLKDVVCVN